MPEGVVIPGCCVVNRWGVSTFYVVYLGSRYFGTVEGEYAGNLKVPKRENFSLAFFAQSEPTWICDLESGEKNRIFYQMTPVFDGFWFFAAY